MSDIKVREVEHFIRRSLPIKVQKDLKDIRIVKEADLESSIYFHMRSYFDINSDDNWRMFARKHTRLTGHFIDLLLFKKGLPRIAMELKWGRYQIGKKDLDSLAKAIKRLQVNRCYFISVVRIGKMTPYVEVVKDGRKFIQCIYIPIGLKGAELREWQKKKSKFTSQIEPRLKYVQKRKSV